MQFRALLSPYKVWWQWFFDGFGGVMQIVSDKISNFAVIIFLKHFTLIIIYGEKRF